MRSLLLCTLAVAFVGCEGTVIGPRVERPVDPNLPEGAPRELPSPSSRVARLSHVEYENTARDFLASPTSLGITSSFIADSTNSTFNNNGGDLNVTSAQWQDYQTAAEELARRATLTPDALAAIAGGTVPADDAAPSSRGSACTAGFTASSRAAPADVAPTTKRSRPVVPSRA